MVRIADLLVRSVGYSDSKDRGYVINYYLAPCGPAFGVSAEKRGLDTVYIESSGGLTYDKDRALSLIDRLAEGTVPPLTLLEIIDDLTGDILGY